MHFTRAVTVCVIAIDKAQTILRLVFPKSNCYTIFRRSSIW